MSTGPVTEKIGLLDAIIKTATKIKKQTLQTAASEAVLSDDLARYKDMMGEDEELRDELRQQEVLEDQKKKEKAAKAESAKKARAE